MPTGCGSWRERKSANGLDADLMPMTWCSLSFVLSFDARGGEYAIDQSVALWQLLVKITINKVRRKVPAA